MDSVPGTIPDDVICHTAGNTVHYSGLMVEEPTFMSEDWRPVIGQQGVNTCGLHTIFNAWAYLLGIELQATATLTPEFYERALAFANLCLMGSVDVTGVKAFSHRFGLATEKSPVTVDRSDRKHSIYTNDQMLNWFTGTGNMTSQPATSQTQQAQHIS